MSTTDRRTRLAAALPGLLFIFGSALFLYGGSFHPRINPSLGPMGSPAFFQAFVDHIRMMPRWQEIHTWILFGPVLWAFGAALAAGRGDPTTGALARMALALGAGAWIVAFVVDGFVHPQLAADMAAAETPEIAASLMRAFRQSATMMARLGLVAWTLVGVAAALYGAGLVGRAGASVAARIIGAAGILIGVWPMAAWVSGEFTPGPFTSVWWTLTAVVTAAWFVAFGVLHLRAVPAQS